MERSTFDGPFFKQRREVRRKRNLKELEDKRVRFAERLAAEGFQPEDCLFVQRDGGFAAVARQGGTSCICSPAPRPAPRRILPSAVGRARAGWRILLIKSEGWAASSALARRAASASG